jgi:hypothetical protein
MSCDDILLAECCDSYGTHAPLGSFNGNNSHKLIRYMDAMRDHKEAGDDISPEYFRGHDRALNVKAGKCPAPGWIKST